MESSQLRYFATHVFLRIPWDPSWGQIWWTLGLWWIGMTAAPCSSPEHRHMALPSESEGKALSHQHHFLCVLGFSLQVIYSRLGWVLTSLGMWDLNLVWLQIPLNRVWFESCQCRDECYRKNKKLFKALFVCFLKSWLLPNVKKVRAWWAVASFPSGPDVLMELRILSAWFLHVWYLQRRVCISVEVCDGFW